MFTRRRKQIILLNQSGLVFNLIHLNILSAYYMADKFQMPGYSNEKKIATLMAFTFNIYFVTWQQVQ